MSFFNILSLGEQLFPSKVSSLSLRKWFFKRISCSLISLAEFQDDKNLNFIFKFWKSHKFPNILNHLYHSLKTFFPVFYNCQKFSLIICNEYFNKVFLVKTTGTWVSAKFKVFAALWMKRVLFIFNTFLWVLLYLCWN